MATLQADEKVGICILQVTVPPIQLDYLAEQTSVAARTRAHYATSLPQVSLAGLLLLKASLHQPYSMEDLELYCLT